MSDARFAVFDKNGKYLYFAASTNSGPTLAGLDMSSDGKEVTCNVYLIVLRKDLPSPLAPESDEEKPATDKKLPLVPKTLPNPIRTKRTTTRNRIRTRTPKKLRTRSQSRSPSTSTTSASASSPSRIPPKNYVDLSPGKIGGFSLSNFRPIRIPKDRPVSVPAKFDLTKRKSEQLIGGIQNFSVSFNGEKFLYQQGENWFIAPTAAAAKPGEGALNSTPWKSGSSPAPNGNRCTTKSGASNAISSTTRITMA